jgi:HEAT repeat protein
MGQILLKVALGACFLSLLALEAHCADPEDVRKWEAAVNTKSLIKALGNEDSTVRVAAAQSLGRIRDSQAVDPLVITLGDEYSGVREAAAKALENLGEPLGKVIVQSLEGAEKAREALAAGKDPRAIVPLLKVLANWDPNVRAAAAQTLGKLKDPRAVEPLVKALEDTSDSVQEAAAWALGNIANPRAIVPLVKALRDAPWNVRVVAGWVLGKFVDRRAVDPLVTALGDEYPSVREAAAYSLGKLGDPRTVVPLIDALGDTHEKVREAAVWSLGKFGDRRAVDPLLKTIWDANPKVREAAAWTLGKFGDRRAVEPLLKTMGDESPKVREAAAKVLDELGEPLGRLIQSTLAGSREAGNELVKRKDPRSLDALILSLRNRDWKVRRAAAMVLGRIRNPRAVDGLVVMAGGWGLRDRVVASAALLEIDQKFFPDLLIAVFRVMARPASLAYLLCIVGLSILAVYGTGWIGRRRGRDVSSATGPAGRTY